MDLVCPEHPGIVLFQVGDGRVTRMMTFSEPTAYCPECGKEYFRGEAVPAPPSVAHE